MSARALHVADWNEPLAAEKLIGDHLGAFRLGQREYGEVFGSAHFREFRGRMAAGIDSLRK